MNAAKVRQEKLTFGERFATFFARVFSSPKFVAIFFTLDISWIILNKLMEHPIDPPPFEGKNTIVSDLTLFIDLIIVMVQRRINETEIKKTAEILHIEKNSTKKTQELLNIEKDTNVDVREIIVLLQDIKKNVSAQPKARKK